MIQHSKLYLESHACFFASIRLKADKNVNTALDYRLKREAKWSVQFSTVVALERIYNRVVAFTSATQNLDSDTISGKCKRLAQWRCVVTQATRGLVTIDFCQTRVHEDYSECISASAHKSFIM